MDNWRYVSFSSYCAYNGAFSPTWKKCINVQFSLDNHCSSRRCFEVTPSFLKDSDINTANFLFSYFKKPLTANELLEEIEDIDFDSEMPCSIVILSPENANTENTDEDSGDENNVTMDNLPEAIYNQSSDDSEDDVPLSEFVKKCLPIKKRNSFHGFTQTYQKISTYLLGKRHLRQKKSYRRCKPFDDDLIPQLVY